MAWKRLRQVKADLTVLSIQTGGEFRDQTVCPAPGLVTMRSRLHFSTSLHLPSLRMASFVRAISCRFVKQVSSLRSWKVSFLSSANKSICGTLARTSTALIDTSQAPSLALLGDVRRAPTPQGGILSAWKRADTRYMAISLAPEAPGNSDILSDAAFPSPNELRAPASVKRTTAVCTPPKCLYNLHWSPRSGLPSAIHSAATTSPLVTVSSRSLT